MPRTISRTDEAFHDTLIHRASGFAVDELGSLYGIRRPASWPTDAWNRVLRSIVYAVKGSYGSMLDVWTEIFRPWAEKARFEVTLRSDQRLVFNGSPTGFPDNVVGKFAEIVRSNGERRIIFIESDSIIADSVNVAVGGFYSAAYPMISSGTETATLHLLPFLFKEPQDSRFLREEYDNGVRYPDDRAKFQVLIDGSLIALPESFMLGTDIVGRQNTRNQVLANTDPNFVYSGSPYGGIIMDLNAVQEGTSEIPGYEASDAYYGDQEIGPFPIYLFGEDASDLLSSILRYLLPAGVKGVVKIVNLGSPFPWAEF